MSRRSWLGRLICRLRGHEPWPEGAVPPCICPHCGAWTPYDPYE